MMGSTDRATSVNYGSPYRPLLISAYNKIATLLNRAGIGGKDFNQASLVKKARERTGLVNLGDASVIDRLELLLDSTDREARLHPLGRFMTRQNIIRLLANRLRIEHALQDSSIHTIAMEDPVFIVGLQRTGTTMLHRYLASDTDKFRYLASWEAINPAPLSEDDRDELRRVRQARLGQRALRYMAPDFFAIHPVNAYDPEEDCLLFDFDFMSTVPEAMQRVPSFSKWLEDQDHTRAYRYYQDILKYLYWQNPQGRWLLKTPQHMEHLDTIFKVFPGAKIIHTHRDPVKVIASFCSMVAHAYGIFSDDVDPLEIGQHWSRKALRMVNHSMKMRTTVHKDSFLDINYSDLMRDPVREIAGIYRFLNTPFSADAEARIIGWRRDNPQHRYGKHQYRLKDFGLEADRIRSIFRPYRENFDIPEEE